MQLTKTAKGKPLICLTVSRSLVPFWMRIKKTLLRLSKKQIQDYFPPIMMQRIALIITL